MNVPLVFVVGAAYFLQGIENDFVNLFDCTNWIGRHGNAILFDGTSFMNDTLAFVVAAAYFLQGIENDFVYLFDLKHNIWIPFYPLLAYCNLYEFQKAKEYLVEHGNFPQN